MNIYPIHVPRHRYRGRDDAKLRKRRRYDEDAAALERYLNAQIVANASPVQQYVYGMIAIDTGISEDRVREVLFGVDGGHTGLTIAKTEEDARAAFDVAYRNPAP